MTFERAFGVSPERIKKRVLLFPLLHREFRCLDGITWCSRGALYTVGQGQHCTVIRTGTGAALAGDAVLYLADTACRSVLLCGTCGTLHGSKGPSPGDIVVPQDYVACEGFSALCEGSGAASHATHPSPALYDMLKKNNDGFFYCGLRCATVGSYVLEGEYSELWRAQGIDLCDMEASAVCAASSRAGVHMAAIFCVSDRIGQKSGQENDNGARVQVSRGLTTMCMRVWEIMRDVPAS